jgi:hypothetical protein
MGQPNPTGLIAGWGGDGRIRSIDAACTDGLLEAESAVGSVLPPAKEAAARPVRIAVLQ